MKHKNIEFIEYKKGDLNDIFSKMISKISTINDEILFDITHSFRDAVIMSVVSTIISQIVYKPRITMIYAKEYKDAPKREYSYELVSDDILNTSNIAFVISTFIETLKTPPLRSKYKLYEELNNFSVHLLSNQFKTIYEEDINNLKNFIEKNREKLFFIDGLIKQLEDIIISIEQTKDKPTYEKFLFFTEFFYKKDYYLHSATYLIEGITQYIATVFQEQNFINFDVEKYENQQKIVALLKLNYNSKDFNFPNEYFVDINIDIINRLNKLREEVAEIRHNLAHINILQDYTSIKEDLDNLINEYKKIINEKVLYSFDMTENKKKDTVKYKLQLHENKIKSFTNTNTTNTPKLRTVINKYNEKKLQDLTTLDTQKVSNYLLKNYKEIEQLFEKQSKRELLIETKKIKKTKN